jgi:hypothetical protein
MILKFPNLDTLRLALTTGAVSPALSQTPATAGFDDQEQLWVETAVTVPKAVQGELKKLGVQVVRSSGATLTTEVTCWPELLPLLADPGFERSEQTPVLFDLASGEQLSRLVTEILRLGNDRQGYRFLDDGSEQRALLRVVGPPYYSLLRALDRNGQEKAPVAYVERGPRVWVELGYRHPLGDHIKPPEGKLLLIRPPSRWTLLDEVPFHDVYEILEFKLPDGPVRWRDKDLGAHVKVVPSLKPAGSTDGAELWVLRDDPVAELNRFVQNADDQMLHRLAFAVGEKDGRTTIVLRVRQSKLPPPVLVLKAAGYKHYLKLTNLFLPVGTVLHPPLRRDQVRKLLADDPTQVTWLAPGAKGSFTPESLPEDGFRPLWDWIDYVLDHEKESLQAWVQAAQFDFEPFVCDEEQQAKPKKPPADAAPKSKKPSTRAGAGDRQVADDTAIEFVEKPKAAEDSGPEEEVFETIERPEPSVMQTELLALENRFLDIEGGLDVPERQEMWPRMADLHSALNHADEAGICWANALWAQDAAPAAWAWSWFRTEASGVAPRGEGRTPSKSWVTRIVAANSGKGREVTGDDLDRLLKYPEPSTADLRALAAYLVWSARRTPPPEALVQRLNPMQRFLEAHERLLPVRACWLAWAHLVQLSRGDVLALARARDRILERLFNNGLRPDQDMPYFLRSAGQPTSQRFRAVRQWMNHLCDMAQKWAREGPKQNAQAPTDAYIDLIFSFGMARLGEHDASKGLLERASAVLTKLPAGTTKEQQDCKATHTFLLGAYAWRIAQALEGKLHQGPLSPEQVEEMGKLDRMPRYLVDRLRQHSRILEPIPGIDPYSVWGARISELDKALHELNETADRREVAGRVERLLAEIPKKFKGAEAHDVRAKILRTALQLAPRVSEEFGRAMLKLVNEAYDRLPEVKDNNDLIDRAKFLEKALFVAAHFDRSEYIHPLVARFQKLVQAQKGTPGLQALDELADQCFRGLRKLGMRDEIDHLLGQMAELILGGQDVKTVDPKKFPNWAHALRTLLHVAGGWYYFGRDRQAEPMVQAARTLLFKNDLTAREQTQLACAYAKAVGQSPVEVAQKRLEELFTKLEGTKDTFTTNSVYSLSHLDVVEAVVTAVASDDFTLGANARRWLDDDEYLVRKRIHRDMRSSLAQT